MNEPKNSREWEASGLPMVWDITKGDTDNTAPDEWLLDFATDAPDGDYEVVADNEYLYLPDDRKGAEFGIMVRDGRFVPKPTALACYRLQAKISGLSPLDIANMESFDHSFIEELRYDPRGGGVFVLRTGS